MSEFVNTTDLLGDDAVCDGIIMNTLTEYADDRITIVNDYALNNNSSLTSIDFPNAIKIGIFSLYWCRTLKSVNLPAATTIDQYAFYMCHSLESIDLPAANTIAYAAFRDCTALTMIHLPSVTLLARYAFYDCSNLLAVILRGKTMCELENTNAFTGTPISEGTGYIYVPSTLVETYKTGTNWSTYADRIRAIEDYPDITGG